MGSLRKSCFVFHIFFLFCFVCRLEGGSPCNLSKSFSLFFFRIFCRVGGVPVIFSLLYMNPSVNYRPSTIMGETENDGRE